MNLFQIKVADHSLSRPEMYFTSESMGGSCVCMGTCPGSVNFIFLSAPRTLNLTKPKVHSIAPFPQTTSQGAQRGINPWRLDQEVSKSLSNYVIDVYMMYMSAQTSRNRCKWVPMQCTEQWYITHRVVMGITWGAHVLIKYRSHKGATVEPSGTLYST